MSKYNAKKIEIDGIVFDSKKEAKRYLTLKQWQELGIISDLNRQVPFELVPAQREEGHTNKKGRYIQGKVIERAIMYYADFVYKKDGQIIVEDTKGFRTADYIIKRKLMLYMHGIRVQEV